MTGSGVGHPEGMALPFSSLLRLGCRRLGQHNGVTEELIPSVVWDGLTTALSPPRATTDE
jgi:hypothetical protein